MCLQNVAIMFSMVFVNAYINSYGVVAAAVTGIGGKLGNITGVITNSLGTAGSAVFMPETVFGLFNSDPEVLQLAMTYVPSAVLLYAGSALRTPFFSLINGSGYARLKLLLGLLDGVVARIGLALLMGITLGMGITGFWYGNALAGFVPFVIGLAYYLSGVWRTRRLI